MALLTLPKSRQPKHATQTPLWRQFGFGRPRVPLTSEPVITPPGPPTAAPAPVAEASVVVARLFPAWRDGLYPLDWRYEHGRATAQVDPGLVPNAARNVVLAYGAVLDAESVEDTVDGAVLLRVSRGVDGVQVTVWADITPDPPAALEAGPVPVVEPLPIERLARCAADDTQVFDPITDDMDDPREHPDTAPDGDPERPQIDPDHTAAPDDANTAAHHGDTDTPASDEATTASTHTDDTSSTPLPPGDEDEEEETHSDG